MKIPEKIKISVFNYFKLKKLLNKSFFVHIYIAHNGFLQYINPSNGKQMLDGYFK